MNDATSSKPPRICFVCDEYPPAMHGGIGSLVQMLARGLVARGHEVRVIGIQGPRCDARQYEEDLGVRIWRLPPARWRHLWPKTRLRLFRTVARWAHHREIDVVEVVDFAGPAAMWPRLPVPVVARIHGSATYFAAELNRTLKRHDYLIERASLRRADYVCSISAYAARRTGEVFEFSGPIEVIHDFIDTRPAKCRPTRQRQTVVFSGTLTAKKGVIPLFKAWRRVVASNPQARLHIYGKDSQTGDGRSMKAQLLALLSPADQRTVVFHGHTSREELFHALSVARVGVFPSYSETFGLGPVESMAAGCPTIYGRCGCAAEIMRDRVEGLLVDPDRPDMIASAIAGVLNNDVLAESLGNAGRLRVENRFSFQSQIRKNETFYRDCVAQFSKQGAPVVQPTAKIPTLLPSDT